MLLAPACGSAGPVDNTNDNGAMNDNDNGDGNGNANDNGVANDNANDNGVANDNDNANDNGVVDGLPLAGFRTENFQGSGNCTVCHSGLTDEGGNDVSIGTDWRATMLANAAVDPFFLASVRSEVDHAPEALRGVVEDVCATCHMPMARTQAVADGSTAGILDDGFLDPENPLHDAAMDGVSCTLCHQVQPDNLGQEDSFDGGYRVDTSAESPDRPLFGPYEDPLENIMQVSVGYTPAFGEHLTTSALCATCHTLFTPTLDAAGEIVGQFPEQTPFLEWQTSIYAAETGEGRTCQDCHMPLAASPVEISTVPGNLEPRTPFYLHEFRGGNVFMLRLLRGHIEALELTASSEQFDDAIATNEAFLQNETAQLAIVDAARNDTDLDFAVRVISEVGHKFPTGFPSRRAWIHLTVRDGDGEVFFESGAPGDGGRIAGCDADAEGGGFEPHYRAITSPDQVQIYESIMGNTDGAVTTVLLRAAVYLKDNRLLPRGFDKESVGAEIAVVGQARDDEDFMGGVDFIPYRIDAGGRTGPFAVQAELLFQSVSYPFIRDLAAEEAPLIQQFITFADETDSTPSLVATAEITVP